MPLYATLNGTFSLPFNKATAGRTPPANRLKTLFSIYDRPDVCPVHSGTTPRVRAPEGLSTPHNSILFCRLRI